MTAPRMARLDVVPIARSSFVTVTKSVPKNTPVTPSTRKDASGQGRFVGASAAGKSAVPVVQHGLAGQELERGGVWC